MVFRKWIYKIINKAEYQKNFGVIIQIYKNMSELQNNKNETAISII